MTKRNMMRRQRTNSLKKQDNAIRDNWLLRRSQNIQEAKKTNDGAT